MYFVIVCFFGCYVEFIFYILFIASGFGNFSFGATSTAPPAFGGTTQPVTAPAFGNATSFGTTGSFGTSTGTPSFGNFSTNATSTAANPTFGFGGQPSVATPTPAFGGGFTAATSTSQPTTLSGFNSFGGTQGMFSVQFLILKGFHFYI